MKQSRFPNRLSEVSAMLMGVVVAVALIAAPMASAQSAANDPQVAGDESEEQTGADTSDGTNAESAPVAYGEITVSATKRDEALQDVPISVSALSGSDLEEVVALNLADYAESVPGMAFNGNEPGNDRLIVRGISTDSFNAQLQSTVGIYIDDMPGIDVFIPTATPDLHMFDVDRVEVLRGPQGTLWGSSAMGGALRIITNKPDVSRAGFRGRVRGATVNDGATDYGIDLMGNIPLVQDKLALRVTGYTRTDAGYLNAINLDKDNSNENTVSGFRASLRWVPTDNLIIDLTSGFQELSADDGYAAYLNDPLNPGISATEEDRVRFNYIPETRDQNYTMANLVIQYFFGNVTFVSSTSFGKFELDSVSDQTTNTSLPVAPFTGGTVFESGFFNDDQSNTLAQEFRFSTDNWVVGAFYLDNDRELRSYQGMLSNAALYPFPLLPGDVQFLQDIDNGRKEMAIFGEYTWHISNKLDATFGARYFDNEQNFRTALTFAPFAPGFPPFETGGDSTTSESDVTPKLSLAYHVNDDVMVYGLASKGYRLGGVNQAALGSPFPIPETFESDTLWNYELGARTAWNGGRTIFNTTVFYIDWRDMQSTFRLDIPGLPQFPFFVNAGTAHSLGIEIELSAQLSNRWRFHTAITALEAEVDDPSEVVGGITDIQAGTKLPGTPDLQTFTWLGYEIPIKNRSAMIRISHRYVGESNYSLESTATQGDYHLFGLNVNAQLSNKVALSLYVDNVGDTAGVTSTVPGNPFAGFAELRYLVRPRTIGLSLQTQF